MTMQWEGRSADENNDRFALGDDANENKVKSTGTNTEVLERDRTNVVPMRVAAEREALGEGVPFEFDNKQYLLDRPEDWDIEVLEMFTANDLVGAVKLLLGDDQFTAFKTDLDGKKIKRTVKDLGKILEVAMGAQGIETGE